MAFYAFDQPKRYNGVAKAKSRVLFLLMPDKGYGRVHLSCHGNRTHYNPADGSCAHIESMIVRMKRWYARRCWYLPWGTNDQGELRAPDYQTQWNISP